MKKLFLTGMLATCLANLFAQQVFVSEQKATGSFTLAAPGESLFLCINATDYNLVNRVAGFLAQDIENVTGKRPEIVTTLPSSAKNVIIIGTIEKSSLIQDLVKQKKINLDKINGKWDAYQLQTVANPAKGIANALVIAGSNKRGAAYGAFELSRQMGVSPWYWWADVPVKKKSAVYLKPNTNVSDAPKVKYRGIFINDEAPAFSGWTKEKFGGVNHLVYEKMFELLLRLKGNYLWPAMWGNAFNDDDKLNPVLADEYGIVMGTSHHEPMLRAQQEWRRYGKGKWDYDSNEVVLKQFWKKGIENMGSHESIVTVGMRGDGDMPMTRGTATALLERIVKDQREIIEGVTHKPASETPQLWALYKEVQDYYDQGMRVPDDVTLLLCDDNWGNIRKLPRITDKPRKGGYGIYYHFDYVGGPRNYKWVNTNPLPRIWEQMHLAYEYNVRDIWVVNVGDLKPMEFPISFWLDYAWNPERIGADDLTKYTQQWVTAQFDSKNSVEIADILAKYGKYSGRRKPELLDQNTYSLANYNEFDNVVKEFNDLSARAEKVNASLPAEYKDAYYQIVLHPVKANANLNEMYLAVARNRLYAPQKLAQANTFADRVKELYIKDSLISIEYNTMNGGKWSHMMDQTHIGYTYWQQPPRNRMPAVTYVPADSIVKGTVAPGATATATVKKTGTPGKANAFIERDGYVSIDADHFTKAVNTNGITWKVLPDHGRTGSAATAFPVTAGVQKPGGNAPHIEYEVTLASKDSVKLIAYFSPSLNFHNDEGLTYAFSIDNEEPQVFSLNKEDNNTRIWNEWMTNNIITKTSTHFISKPGKHTVKFWMIKPGVVLQKIVIDAGGLKPSLFGPSQTIIK